MTMNITENIIKVLRESDEPMKTGDIANVLNMDKKEVDKGIKTLKQEDKIFSPKRCFYSAK